MALLWLNQWYEQRVQTFRSDVSQFHHILTRHYRTIFITGKTGKILDFMKFILLIRRIKDYLDTIYSMCILITSEYYSLFQSRVDYTRAKLPKNKK